jgi:hypothetical protein
MTQRKSTEHERACEQRRPPPRGRAARGDAPGSKKPMTVVAKHPSLEAGTLTAIGGSASDDWNNRIANDTIQTLWLKNSDEETKSRQMSAAIAGLVGIAPKDELDGMMAAQHIASHSAAMECYRRAMIGEQTFEGRRENLSQANKLSRTFTMLLDSLNRHRGKGQQKVTVEHVHVHSGGQAIVGAVTPGGVRSWTQATASISFPLVPRPLGVALQVLIRWPTKMHRSFAPRKATGCILSW